MKSHMEMGKKNILEFIKSFTKITIIFIVFSSLRFGFITFAEASAAYEVLDKFKLDPTICIFDIRFGGRRKFCKQTYADLDSLPKENDIDIYNNNSSSSASVKHKSGGELSFEDLLNIAKRKLCKQK